MEVVIDQLGFVRDGRTIIDIPSLRVDALRTTAILGPNGAGKTTLLRLIAALEPPTRGRILAGGRPVRDDAGTHHRLAFVFQQQVFLRRSVRDNLDLGPMLRGVTRRDRDHRIEHAAQLLGIGHLLGRDATSLSEGEGRRASLARALCLRAPLVLLDEPLAGLDVDAYERLLDELPEILRAMGATALLVTHDRNEALRLADQLVVLIEGRVHAAGPTLDVVRTPRSAAVAEALGSTVLTIDGSTMAIPPGSLTCGPGSPSLSIVVDEVVDLIDRREVVGRIGGARVHARLPPGEPVPERGGRISAHAPGAVTLP